MLAPERIIQMGGKGVTLTGDLFAAMEYADLTGGDSFEDAFFTLKPAIEAQEKGEELKGKYDPRPYVDLVYAFSANWRDENGWNTRHARDNDAEMPVRKQGPYKAMMKAFPFHDLRELRAKLFGLLLSTIIPPHPAAVPTGDGLRSEDTSPETNETGV